MAKDIKSIRPAEMVPVLVIHAPGVIPDGGVDFGFIGEDNFGRRTARFCGLPRQAKCGGEWQGDDASRLRYNLEVDFQPPNFGSLVPGDQSTWEWRLTQQTPHGWWHVVSPYVPGQRVPATSAKWFVGGRSYTISAASGVKKGDPANVDLSYIALARQAQPGYNILTRLQEEIAPDVWMVEQRNETGEVDVINGNVAFERLVCGHRDKNDSIHREGDRWWWGVCNGQGSASYPEAGKKSFYASASGPIPPVGSDGVWIVASESPTVIDGHHSAGQALHGWGFYHPLPYLLAKEQESLRWSVDTHSRMDNVAQEWVVSLLLVAGRCASPRCDCGNCGSTGPLKRCSRCKSARYCSPEHQKEAWPKHKAHCRKSDKDATIPSLPRVVWYNILSLLREWHLVYYQ